MKVKYNHSKNRHSLRGPEAFLPVLFSQVRHESLADVGCGAGTWTKTAMDLGVKDIVGIDGIKAPGEKLLIPAKYFVLQDLRQNWNLGRRFDVALCLEVAEHLEAQFAPVLVRNLTRVSDTVVFSAACPGQEGQNHVNCQWPSYWQRLFNEEGFACSDALRWKIWNDCRIEPWYRQNVFIATRDAARAGQEERLQPVIHPEFLYGEEYEAVKNARFSSMGAIEGGGMTLSWYLRTPLVGLAAKVANRLKTRNGHDAR